MTEVLPIILYILGSILLVVLIILGIKLIITMDKINLTVDNINTNKLANVSDKVVETITELIRKIFVRKKEEENVDE